MLFDEVTEDWSGPRVVTLPYFIFNPSEGSGGSRYFNSGIVPAASTRVELLMGRNPAATLDRGWETGCRTGWISNALSLNYSPISGRVWIIYGDGTYGMNEVPVDPEFGAVLISFGADGVMSAGNVVFDSGQPLVLAGNSIYIGDVNVNGTDNSIVAGQGSAKMYWCKIYDGQTLVKHYVPDWRNGSPVLHELVSGAYLQSTGRFAESTIVYGTETVTVVDGGKIEMTTY